MNTSPKLSIIVPIYNVQEFLRECLDSIKNQTFTDFEVLLIDDGSPDGSGAICDEYAKIDSRFRVFHKQNEGVSLARNFGMDNARGEWIGFIDSDDYLLSNKMYEEIFENDLTDVDLIKFGYGYHRVYIAESILEGDDVIKNLTKFTNAWSVLLNKKTLGHHRFEKRRSEDTLFIQLALKDVNKVLNINKRYYFYRENPASYTKNYMPEYLKNITYIFNKVLQQYKDNVDFPHADYNELIVRCFCYGVGQEILNRPRKEYMKNINEAASKLNIKERFTWNLIYDNNKLEITRIFVKIKAYRLYSLWLKNRKHLLKLYYSIKS